MPWCPVCRFEYVSQVTHCPECGRELVGALPAEPGPMPEYGEGEEFEQVLLCTVLGDVHRALVQNALAAAGIPSRSQRAIVSLFPAVRAGVPAPASVPQSIYVNKRDLARALEVHQAYEATPKETRRERG